jgi:hypothetical protein
MSSIARAAALGVTLVLVSGCGGGSGASGVTPAGSAAMQSTASGTGTLTLHYPTSFHTATFSSTTQSVRRSPKYINPSPNGYTGYIDIFINGVDAITATVAPSESDGTQQFTIPLFTGSDQVVVVETELGLQAGNGTILAIGETDVQQGYIGGPLTLNLTMEQNIQYIGLMSTSTGANATVGSVFSPQQCTYQGSQLTVYPFAADAAGGFVLNSGAGGSAVPTLVSFSDPGQNSSTPYYGNGVNFDTVNASTSGSLTGYTVTYTSSAGEAALNEYFPADLNFSVDNQAAVIYNDAIQNEANPGYGSYPGIEKLYSNTTKVLPLGSLSTTNPLTATIAVTPNENGC